MVALTPSLTALSLASTDVGTPASKRKAAVAPSGHWGLTNDSASAVALVVLSRLYRSRDETTLAAASRSPFGLAVLAALRALVLRVAIANGGADPALSESNLVTMFNLGSSHIAQQRLYESGLTLPGRLPWANAKRLVVALYDSLATARNIEAGLDVANLLMEQGTDPASTKAQAAIQTLVEAVDPAVVARLAEGGGASSSGSGAPSSSSSAASTPPPLLPPPPAPRFAIATTLSLHANLHRLVEHRLRRPLTAPEGAAITAALDEGLSMLQSGGAAARQQLLATNVLLALASQGASWLWSAALESIEEQGQSPSVATVAAAITESCNGVAAMLFASAAMGTAIGTSALRRIDALP